MLCTVFLCTLFCINALHYVPPFLVCYCLIADVLVMGDQLDGLLPLLVALI